MDKPITLTGQQIKNLLEFVAPDDTPDQLETEVCIQWCPDRVSEEGEPMPAGYYMWFYEYPEEGCYLLDVATQENTNV